MNCDEGELLRAQDFGRALVKDKVPPEDVAALHEMALAKVDDAVNSVDIAAFVERSSTVLLEVLMAYGLAHREQLEHLKIQSAALRESEERYRQVFEHNHVAQILIDPHSCQIVEANCAAGKYFGQNLQNLQNVTLDSLSTDSKESIQNSIHSVVENNSSLFYFSHVQKSGAVLDAEFHATPINIREQTLVFAIIQDITERRKAEGEVQFLATHDPLTNLPNRTLFCDRIEMMLAKSKRFTTPAALISLNIDGFKTINDALGSDRADLVLIEMAKRLKNTVRSTDTVARLGSDEFGITWTDLKDTRDISVIINKIIRATEKPIDVNGRDIRVTASMGVSIYPHDATTSASLLLHSEQAMHRAKEKGGRQYECFVTGMDQEAAERRRLEDDLYAALERGELELFYQGQVDIRSGGIYGAEALLRWKSPSRGYISPASFIPVAEANGLIVPIGEWVLKQACKQISEWSTLSNPPVVSVNMSPVQLREANVVDMMHKHLETYNVNPLQLNLELTETAIMHDDKAGEKALNQFHQMKIGLALDDFGTGFSSLSYLNRYSFSKLKIDREFITDISTDTHAVPLVDATISMGHSLGMAIVAEGVENMDQVAYLRNKGCDLVQGYVFSRPIPAVEFTRFMNEWNKSVAQ